MFRRILHVGLVALLALISNTIVWWLLAFFIDWPRLAFVSIHLALIVLVFGGVFLLYYQTIDHWSAAKTTLIVLITLIVSEFLLDTFLFIGDSRLTVTDWLLPLVIAAGTVYSVRELY